MEGRLILTVMAIIFGMMICGTSSAVDLDQNYTNDSDFDSGTLTGLEHNSTSDQLQLSNNSQSANHMD